MAGFVVPGAVAPAEGGDADDESALRVEARAPVAQCGPVVLDVLEDLESADEVEARRGWQHGRVTMKDGATEPFDP